jgi:hypothetical protein
MDNVGVNGDTSTLTFEAVWPEATGTVFAPDDRVTIVTVAVANLVPSSWLVAITLTRLGEGTLVGAW